MHEKRDLKRLFRICFPQETNEYIDYFFDRVYRRKNALYKKVSGKIVSGFHIVEKDMRIAGHDFFVPFIMGVGTLPEFRSKGFMDELLVTALNTLKEKKMDFLTVGTDDMHEFYEKYGFKTYTFYKHEKFLAKEKRQYKLTEIKSKSTEAAGVLESVYERFTKGKNGYIVRDREYFIGWQEEVFADKGRLWFIKEGKDFTGYIYDDNGDYKEVVLLDPSLADSLKEFEGKKYKIFADKGKPHNMIRLLKPISALKKITYAPDADDVLNIKIDDGKIKANNITIKLDVENGEGLVEETKDKPDYTVDIEDLAALIMGLETKLPERITKLFNKQENLVLDRY